MEYDLPIKKNERNLSRRVMSSRVYFQMRKARWRKRVSGKGRRGLSYCVFMFFI